MTIYNKGGVTVELIDNEAIAVYIEGVFRCEVTLREFTDMANAVMAAIMEEVK